MITWAQNLGKPECPYLTRWVFDAKIFSIRLHHWRFGDDPRHPHDHPWNFFGLVLWGSYIDITPQEGSVDIQNNPNKEKMWLGKIFFRHAEHIHSVETKGCWTLLLTGPELREWGFWQRNKSNTRNIWFKAKRYFIKKGHHPCQ